MTNTSLRKYWITLISLCTIGATIVLACVDDWGPEYGTSSFTPEVFVDSAYSPFFYSNQFYYGINYDDKQITRWNAVNNAEWSGWLGNTAPAGEISFLLDSADAPTISSLAAYATGQTFTAPAQAARFRILQNRGDKKVIAFFRYLDLAKKCEAFSLTPIDQPWERDSTKPKPHFNAGTLNQQLTNQFNLAEDRFIKQRYWFQLTRSCFFNGNPQMAVRLWDLYNAKFPHNKLWYRTLAYSAGGYYKQKQYSKANYYYSRVFDSCDELKTVAHYSFHPQEEGDWQATLALCQNTEEKATLWQMLGIFYADPQRAITNIYQLDPAHRSSISFSPVR